MSITDQPICIHHTHEWHASQLEEIDLLPVSPRHIVTRVGQADERKLLIDPVFTKGILVIGTDGENLRTAARELLIVVA